MPRRTKIVCTIGPATSSEERIAQLVDAGMNVARLNFSHGSHEHHALHHRRIRAAADATGMNVAIMVDLQGPKIRTGTLEGGGPIDLVNGQHLVLTTEEVVGTAERVSVSYANLAHDVKPGDRILLADGTLELRAEVVAPPEVRCRILRGGILGQNKGINLPGVDIREPSLTDKDREDLAFALGLPVDYVALSFVRRPEDVREVKELIRDFGANTGVVAKIERPEALRNFDAILTHADAVMVARGDLGVEVPFQEVPIIQKRLIHLCNECGVPVITATQMLESMVDNGRPTRAEVTDVANAIFDGTDAVMLSAETAAGQFPIEACRVMASIAEQTDTEMAAAPPAERWIRLRTSDLKRRTGTREDRGAHQDTYADAIGQAVTRMADAIDIRRIVCFTSSGYTAAAIARYRPITPVTAITYCEEIRRRCALLWGVTAVKTDEPQTMDEMVNTVEGVLQWHGMAQPGEKIIIVAGAPLHLSGRTNFLQLHTLGDRPDWQHRGE